jgi:starch synthase
MNSEKDINLNNNQSNHSQEVRDLNSGLSVYFASSEIAPFAKTGGLGDVIGSLPKALKKLGLKVSLVMPAYRSVLKNHTELKDTGISFNVPVSDRWEEGQILTSTLDDDIPVYFIRADKYFDRNSLYGESGNDYNDNAERFIFFSRAILEVLKLNPPSILHANDWQTALSILFLKSQPALYPELSALKTVLTVHNLGHQGVFWHLDWPLLKLDWKYFTPDFLEFYGKINFLKGGLVFADAITTVSPTYSQEILTPEQGFGLDGVFASRKNILKGLLNGADYEIWDPEIDPFIKANYDQTRLSGKKECKQELQSIFRLPQNPAVPVIGLVSRLAIQKGFGILRPALDQILARKVQIILLGSGDIEYESYFQNLSSQYPEIVGVKIGYDEVLAHKVIAGSDIFLMPSLYEPGGLTQIYSLKYGTIPVARATGGLKDTITRMDPQGEFGDGFLFDHYDPSALVAALDQALSSYSDEKKWQSLMQRAMAADFSWSRSAELYKDLYQKLTGLQKPPSQP